MQSFSEHIKAEYAAAFDLAETEATLDKLIARVVPESDGYMLSPVSQAPAIVHDLMQCGLRRSLELSEAAIAEINKQNFVNMCVLVRAAFETECLLFDAATRVRKVVRSNDTKQLEELCEHLKKIVIGGKSEWKISDVETVSILTAIQRTSKELEGVAWKMYEMLSEYAHPNYHGMLATYTKPGKPACVTTFVNRRDERVKTTTSAALATFSTGLHILEVAYERYDGFIEDLALLAERRHYEAGEWPKELPYPLVRPLNWKIPEGAR